MAKSIFFCFPFFLSLIFFVYGDKRVTRNSTKVIDQTTYTIREYRFSKYPNVEPTSFAQGSSLQQLTSVTPSDCGTSCKAKEECVSFLYYRVQPPTCTLLDSPINRHSVRRNMSVDYYEIQNKCSENTTICNFGTCYPHFGNDSYTCYCKGKSYGKNCERTNSAENPHVTCQEVKQLMPEAPSGMYWVGSVGAKNLLFCDMITDGGGWLRVGQINIRNNEEANAYNFNAIVKPFTSSIHNLSTSNYLLSGRRFEVLNQMARITQFRVYCRKVTRGRTNHYTFDVSTSSGSNNKMFDHVLKNDEPPPLNLCGKIKFLPDDDSKIQTFDCADLVPIIDYDDNKIRYRLYAGLKKASASTGRKTAGTTVLKCDENDSNDKIGQWMFFIR
ncbi:uncharacterized protein [Clytia hemisphaerica]|uniref:uncharacterized protein n=1 Tax=Clytia hemisphaerica TaxID=252671 RepID=UPI0034D6A3DA|eukprot:TCONS_00041858-protein